jgi:diguanylate cyclase (GGDEF)-like protein
MSDRLDSEVDVAAGAFTQSQAVRYYSAAAVHAMLLVLAGVVVVMTATRREWDPSYLAIITGLSVTSELTYIEVPSARLRFSGSFLGLVLAAVLLGGGAAALVGVTTIAVGWLRSKEAPHHFRNNLVMFAWFPLISGLVFHALESSNRNPLTTNNTAYWPLVFGTFAFALLLNFAMVIAWQWYLYGAAPRQRAKYWQAMVAPELAAALLTLVAVFLKWKLQIFGLAMFALVLVVFQYLVGELLTSQQRGEELRRLATTDELTGLANRKRFGDRLDREIAACRQSGEAFGVILLDLDRFKEINDTLGHQYGDDLLAQLGPRLAAQFGPDGLVARLGGDEFAILTGQRTDRADVLERIASDLIACVHQPIVIGDISLEVGSSVGIARYPMDGDDAQTLLRRADIAMYTAKEHRDGFRLYQAAHDHHSTRRLSIIGDFRRALTRDEIVVHFQPIVELSSQRVSGAEALVRWEHPTLGLLEPSAFLQIVEQTGLIGELTRRVLDRSLRECARWRAAGSELTVAVNLSVRNLHDPHLAGEVHRLLVRHAVPAGALQLEITESMIMSDPERAIATVRDLSALGIRLAVDDFGTGHSSLANLKRLPIDELKIDRSFVTPMLGDDSDLIIVRSTINLAHDLGLKTIAEGVEDAATLARLQALGCDLAQGNHLSKPMTAPTFDTWVLDYTARADVA